MGGENLGSGYLEKALRAIRNYLLIWFLVAGVSLIGTWWIVEQFLDFPMVQTLAILSGVWLFFLLFIGTLVANKVSSPFKAVAQAILHVAPSPIPVQAPQVEKLTIAKELVANLNRQVYDYVSGSRQQNQEESKLSITIQKLPVAIIGLDHEANITLANPKAQEYAGTSDSIVGKNLYGLFDILFRTEDTLESWIEKTKNNAVTAQKYWHVIKVTPFGGETKYFDLAAHYSQPAENSKTEVILSLFDQTDIYSKQDDSLSFIALAVHELRSPLTILRGYIEVFEDELSGSLSPEMQDFMQKMQVSAEDLTAFVGNILNVAKVEQNQLSLKLVEEDWKEILTRIIDTMSLRAKVHKKVIQLNIDSDLPKVGIDRVSISEVIMNLIDNAIKYSPAGKDMIKVESYLTKDGLVETIVQDYGVGVPQSVMPHLFEKFSRNYRNQASISGTGLGLYLSKALVNAHGGNIWVRSKEGEGTIFGFTIQPYAKLADGDKSGDNKTITRNAHGWIKNHSLSRQ
ncbi:MAG TPA: ATP-binding protein [Candidatus Saccharimonadales bacterium]|nr:ATP-binding protein [Candidatus Saccharimonadales bacterium]